MSSTGPGSKSMAEFSDGLAAWEGQHIRHKELQANQFDPHHLQSVSIHPFAIDTVDSRLPPAPRTGWLQITFLHDWPSPCCQWTLRKTHKYNILLCFAFVDYEKAFGSIKFKPIFHVLKNHGVNKAYLNIIKHQYCKAMSVICLHTNSEKFRFQRGVRQGDNISHRHFTLSLQDAIIGNFN